MKSARQPRHNKASAKDRPLRIYFEDPDLLRRFKADAKANRRSFSAHAQVLIERGLHSAMGGA